MYGYLIKNMESEEEINGKGYVHYKAWHETYRGLIDAEYLEKHTLEKCTAIAHKHPDNVIIAKDGNKVIGFAAYGAYRNDILPHCGADCGEIGAIYLLKEYQLKGIGHKLIKTAMEKLSEYKKIALWVLKGNEKAIFFMNAAGFTLTEQSWRSCSARPIRN